ncbi:MAG: transposase [Myxococcales bacterium]|nr:transposase [Myxococcales bacterium]
MSEYRRVYLPGATYFFTVVTEGRQPILTRPENVDRLREAFRRVRARRPFEMEAVVILPDHLHCIWCMPDDDADYSLRWRLIKDYFSRAVAADSRGKGEKRVWQRRFWEHVIRDDDDRGAYLDYIFYNPVKHGYVARPGDWPHGSFRDAVKRGWYEPDWGAAEPASVRGVEVE